MLGGNCSRHRDCRLTGRRWRLRIGMLCRPCGLLAELVDARDSEEKLSAPAETLGAEPLKVGEGLTANPEPSPSDREGVETGRAAPKAATAVMVKGQSRPRTLRGRRKPKWYENPSVRKSYAGSSPAARTIFFNPKIHCSGVGKMAFVELNRSFFPLHKDQQPSLDFRRAWGSILAPFRSRATSPAPSADAVAAVRTNLETFLVVDRTMMRIDNKPSAGRSLNP